MLKYTRHLGAPFVFASVILLGACSSDAKKGPDSLALGADSTLNRDLALAGRDTTAQPQLKDVPPGTAAPRTPSRPAPRAPARPPANTPRPNPNTPTTTTTSSGNTVTTTPAGGASGGGAVGMIPAGSTLNAHAASKICTNTNAVGDHVTATVENSVSGSNGR